MAPRIFWREGDTKITLKDSFKRIQSGDIVRKGSDIVLRAKIRTGAPVHAYRLEIWIQDQAPGKMWGPGKRLWHGDYPGTGIYTKWWYLFGDTTFGLKGARYAYYNPGILPVYMRSISVVNTINYKRKFKLRLREKLAWQTTFHTKDEFEFTLTASDVTITANKTTIDTGDVVTFTGTAPPNSSVRLIDLNTYLGGQNVTFAGTVADSRGVWSHTGPVMQQGPIADLTLNIVARAGDIESKPVVIKVTATSVITEALPPKAPSALKWIAGIAGVTVLGAVAYRLAKGGR